MTKTYITIPEENDVFLRIIISKEEYKIRFTYNDTFDYWTFGLYTHLGEPIEQGIKIIPNFPLNVFSNNTNMPDAAFYCETLNDRVGRYDFKNGQAKFYYLSAE